MIDRIEELLSQMAAEDDEEQQEDVLVLPVKEETVPASPRGDGGEAGDGEMGDRSGGRTAGEILLERPGLIAGETRDGKAGDGSGGQTAGETVEDRTETAGEIWKDGPVWSVRSRSSEMDEAQRIATGGRSVQSEETLRRIQDGELIWSGLQWAVQSGTTGPELEGTRRFEAVQAGLEQTGLKGLEQAGLKGLYRQTVQGLRPAAPALPPEQAGRTVRAQEPGSAASLAVDELDRAVRRDSRRYDGGMSIY